jgi:hypothetical protein
MARRKTIEPVGIDRVEQSSDPRDISQYVKLTPAEAAATKWDWLQSFHGDLATRARLEPILATWSPSEADIIDLVSLWRLQPFNVPDWLPKPRRVVQVWGDERDDFVEVCEPGRYARIQLDNHGWADEWIRRLCAAAYPDDQDTTSTYHAVRVCDLVAIEKVARNLARHYGNNAERHLPQNDPPHATSDNANVCRNPKDPRQLLMFGEAVHTGGEKARVDRLLCFLANPLGKPRTRNELFEKIEGYSFSVLHGAEERGKGLSRLRRTVSDANDYLRKARASFIITNEKHPGDEGSAYMLVRKF